MPKPEKQINDLTAQAAQLRGAITEAVIDLRNPLWTREGIIARLWVAIGTPKPKDVIRSKITITIDTDGEAFKDNPNKEVANVLWNFSNWLRHKKDNWPDTYPIRDRKFEVCGSFEVTDIEPTTTKVDERNEDR